MPKVSRKRDGRMLTAEERNRPDLGADGPAMKARTSRVIETKDAGIHVRQMERAETYPLDRYEAAGSLLERQVNALRRLQVLYASGFGFPKLVPSDPAGTLSEELAMRKSDARRSYAEAMARVPLSAQSTLAEVVRSEWPRATDALMRLRVGADILADYWGFPKGQVQGA